jgi:hypothetical protein
MSPCDVGITHYVNLWQSRSTAGVGAAYLPNEIHMSLCCTNPASTKCEGCSVGKAWGCVTLWLAITGRNGGLGLVCHSLVFRTSVLQWTRVQRLLTSTNCTHFEMIQVPPLRTALMTIATSLPLHKSQNRVQNVQLHFTSQSTTTAHCIDPPPPHNISLSTLLSTTFRIIRQQSW